MTREDAVTTLKDISEMVHKQKEIEKSTLYGILDSNNEPIEALDMAIKVLEQEPCEDCISRAEAIEINKKYHGQMPNDINHQIWQELNDLPSIQPKTDVLDKIRAEIKEESRFCPFTEGLERALEIIDKYKTESEDEE